MIALPFSAQPVMHAPSALQISRSHWTLTIVRAVKSSSWGCSYSFVNPPNSSIGRGIRASSRKPWRADNQFYAAELLRDVRDLVPHDRVDHLQPLSRDGLERLAVRHAAVAVPCVILDPYCPFVVVGMHSKGIAPLACLSERTIQVRQPRIRCC